MENRKTLKQEFDAIYVQSFTHQKCLKWTVSISFFKNEETAVWVHSSDSSMTKAFLRFSHGPSANSQFPVSLPLHLYQNSHCVYALSRKDYAELIYSFWLMQLSFVTASTPTLDLRLRSQYPERCDSGWGEKVTAWCSELRNTRASSLYKV